MSKHHHVTVGKPAGKKYGEVKTVPLNEFHRYRRLGFEKVPDEVVQGLREEAALSAAKRKADQQAAGSKKKTSKKAAGSKKKTSKKGAAGGDGDQGGSE